MIFQKTNIFFLTGIFFVSFAGVICAQEIPAFPPLQSEDRIMVLAPHPDDETIGAAGVLEEATRRNIPVKIIYLTNGDSNELAFIVYEKHIVFKPSGVMFLGELRKQEATSAMASLGIKKENLVFLGYPDAGTLKIFLQYWGVLKAPYKSILTRVNQVPYKDSYSYEAPYVGESVLQDLEKNILDFRPTRIIVSHPLDSNADHRAYYLFLRVALWDLGNKIKTPQIYPYLVHEKHWPLPRGFNPDLALDPPEKVKTTELSWFRYPLTPEQIEKKRAAIDLYKSQIEYNPPYLYTFARKNELFGDYPVIRLKDNPSGEIDWRSIDNSQIIPSLPADENDEAESVFESLAYARQDGFLYIKLVPHSWKDRFLGVNVQLIGFRKGLPFSYMPKYRLKISFSRFVSVFEKEKRVFIKDLEMKRYGKEMVIKFPLASLENPHYILSSARSTLRDTTVDRTAWRILELE